MQVGKLPTEVKLTWSRAYVHMSLGLGCACCMFWELCFPGLLDVGTHWAGEGVTQCQSLQGGCTIGTGTEASHFKLKFPTTAPTVWIVAENRHRYALVIQTRHGSQRH